MTLVNPLQTTFDEQFLVGESDFLFYNNYACRCNCGAILYCRSGQAQVTVNQYQGSIHKDTLILILPGAMFMLTDCSADLRIMYFAFSRDLFAEAGRRLDPAFFRALGSHPINYPPRRILRGIPIWYDIFYETYRDRKNNFRNTIIRNRLQNILLEIYDKLKRYGANDTDTTETTTRQIELFRRFVALVQDNYMREREVTYYANQLCITTRYLSSIVRHVIHTSAKEFIDRAVIVEIKIMLQSTDFSIQEIAFKLHFPDQSYLGRYFKKHTGFSPSEYRHSLK